MVENDWRNHISSDPKVLNGKLIFRNTRISIELILELLAAGWTNQMIFESYPKLSSEDLPAIFNYLNYFQLEDKK